MSAARILPRRALVLLAFVLAAVCALPAQSQLPTRAAMPDAIVLVVKFVEGGLLRPSTGVVVGRSNTGDGLVVVSAEFAGDGEGLNVLDVGTDLERDGIPARLLRSSSEGSLALLAVPGLSRPAARVTFNTPERDHELRLAAFPPAEMLADGALPFWIPVNVAGKVTGENQALLPGSAVPNLTGPLLDLCGQWSGLVIASGEPGINAVEPPRVILGDEMLRLTEAMDIDLRLEACMQFAPVGGVAMQSAPAPAPNRTGDGGPSWLDQLLDEAQLGKGALVFLLSALISGLVFWILVKRRAAQQRRQKIRRTMQADTMTFSATGMPTRRTREDHPPSRVTSPATQAPGAGGWLRIEGTHADGRPLRAVTSIGDGRFQAVIGRAGVQLTADGPGISRRHAVILGEGGRLLISDLGSRNGTFVNGVRCQQDEVFFIDEKDKILLGAAEIIVRMAPARGPVT